MSRYFDAWSAGVCSEQSRKAVTSKELASLLEGGFTQFRVFISFVLMHQAFPVRTSRKNRLEHSYDFTCGRKN